MTIQVFIVYSRIHWKYLFVISYYSFLCAPQETSLKNAEAIIKHGLQRYMDQTGRLWNCLAQYYINSALFERVSDRLNQFKRDNWS